MLPTQLVVRNYRGYATEQALGMRPLTLLFGRNNAGKSALIRAVPLLAASARARGSQALDMTCPAIGRASFDELRWHFPSEELPREMSLGLRWSDAQALDLAFTWHERRWIHVAGLRVGGPSQPWYTALPPRGATPSPTLTFRRRGAPDSEAFTVRFDGLRLAELKGPAPEGLAALGERLGAFGEAVQWLGASRRPRERLASYDELRGDGRLEHDGANIIPWLVEHPQALPSINRWYEKNINAQLKIEERPPVGYEITLSHVGRPELRVNLLDTGEGNIQVLPVLAALAAAEGGFGPSIVVLEEPESHLHPQLQMALAARIRQTIEGHPEVRVILETHSEHLLLALQKSVLTGFSADDIGLYWVEQLADGSTVARSVAVHADGSLDRRWPPGVFDDTLRVAAELTDLQIQRQRQDQDGPA